MINILCQLLRVAASQRRFGLINDPFILKSFEYFPSLQKINKWH